MNKERSSGISAVIGIVILILLVLILSAGVLFAAQTLVGDQPNQMVGGMTEERVSPYEQRVSLVSQGNAENLTIVSPLGTEYNLSQVGDSQLYLAVSPSVSGAQDPQILGVKNGERQVLTSSEIRDGIPADIVVDKHGTGDYTSIRNALNNTQKGDIIVIEKATYNENIDVPKNISLIAEHGTVIQDQNPAEPVINIENGHVTVMNFIIDADPVPGDNHYASHGILVKGNNTEVIGNTIRNATDPAGDSAGLRVESDGVVARYNNFKNNEFSLSVASGVGSVQLCSNQLDGGLHGSFSKSTYETFVMRNYWNKGVPSTVLNNVLSDRPNVTATDVSRNAVNFNKVFETSNDQEILAAKAFPGTRLFGGAPCGIQLSFTNQGSSVDVVNASISYEIKNVTYNVTFNKDNTATFTRGNNSTTTSYSVSGGDTSWDTGESLSLASPDSGSSDTSGVWSSGSGGGGGASFWGGGTGGSLSGGSLFGSGGGASLWGVSSGTTSSDVKVTKSPTNTTASVEQTPPENVTETEKENVTVDLGADFKATVGDEISLDAVVTGGSSPYNYTWELGDSTTSYSKSVTHIYDSTGNYTISLNVTDSKGQSDTDSITVWIQKSTTTTKTKNDSLTLNEQVNNLSPGETLVIPSGSYNTVNVDVSGVTLVGDGSVTINRLSVPADNVKMKNVKVTGPLSITGSDYSMYDSTVDNTGGAWAIEVYETGAYFDGVTGEANNGMYVARALQDIQFTSGSLTANSGQGVLVKKHTGIVEITDSSITATGAGIYREHGSQLYLTRNSISGSPNVERILNKPPQPAFTYNDAPLDTGGYGVKFDPSPTTDPEGEPITSMKWDFNNDSSWDAYGDGVKQYTYPDYGTYNVTLSVTDYHGVTVNLERQITINEYYFAISTDKSTINTSETIEFNATTSVPDSNIDHYNIDYDGDGTAEEQVNSLPVTHTYTTAGNYSPQIELVTTSSGTLVNSTDITVLSPPIASFTTNTSSLLVNETVTFNASNSTDPDGGSLTYQWSLGDGTIKTGKIITHKYESSGDYTVTLTVTDDESSTNTSSKTVSAASSTGSTRPLPDYYDSFEDGDIQEYTGDKAPYTVSSGWVDDGMYSLQVNYNSGSHSSGTIYSTSGLNAYPQRGEKIRMLFKVNEYQTGGWCDPNVKLLWGGKDKNNAYSAKWIFYPDPNTNSRGFYLTRRDESQSGGRVSLGETSAPTASMGSVYSFEVVYGVKNITAKLYSGRWDTLEATITASDTTFNSSGLGLQVREGNCAGGGNNGYIDGYVDYIHPGRDNYPPTAEFSVSPDNPSVGETVSFDATGSSDSDGSISTYEWDFNNNGSVDATGQTVSYSYSSSGDKTVVLTVTDNDGDTNTTTKTVSVTEPSSNTLTWSTATDWNNAVSESGVVHENVQNTSHNDASVVKKGYSITNPYQSDALVAYWPLQESDTSTAYDFSYNGYNATSVSGTSTVTSGLGGVRTRYFDGSSDHIDIGQPLTDGKYTLVAWVKPESVDSSNYDIMGDWGNSAGSLLQLDNSNTWYVWHRDASGNYVTASGGSPAAGEWTLVAATYDGTDVKLYENNTVVGTASPGSLNPATVNFNIGASGDTSFPWKGEISNAIYYNQPLSQSSIQTLYDVLAAHSTLTTSSKSFGSPVKPDLTNVSYTMDSDESINITVIGSPGTTSEETNTVTLNGMSEYDLTWNNAHTDYRIKITLDTSDVTGTPSINSLSLNPNTDEIPTPVDTFEDGNTNEYTIMQGGSVSIVESHVYDGSKSMRILDGSNQNTIIQSTGGLSRYPQQNETFSARVYYEPGYFGEESSNGGFIYGVGSEASRSGYYVFLSEDGMTVMDNPAWNNLAQNNSFTPPSGEWLQIEVTWNSNNTHDISVYNAAGTRIGHLTFTDDKYAGNTGIGWGNNDDQGDSMYADHVVISQSK